MSCLIIVLRKQPEDADTELRIMSDLKMFGLSCVMEAYETNVC